MLPFPMFASPSTSPTNRSPHLLPPSSNLPHPEHREGSAFRLSPPRALSAPAFCSYPSPFSLELSIEDSHPVGTVNFPSLSSFPATLTDTVDHNPFVCHSYKKHRGSAIVSFLVARTSVCAPLGRLTSASSESKHPQEFKNLAVLPVTLHRSLATSRVHPLPPVTSHQSRITNSFIIGTSKTKGLKPFRMNTYEKTGEGPPAHAATHYSRQP